MLLLPKDDIVWLGMIKALFKLHPESLQRLLCVDETVSVKRRGKVKSLKEWKNGLVLSHRGFGLGGWFGFRGQVGVLLFWGGFFLFF